MMMEISFCNWRIFLSLLWITMSFVTVLTSSMKCLFNVDPDINQNQNLRGKEDQRVI